MAFLETVYFACSYGMVKLGNLPINGTIIKANTSNQHSISEEDLELVRNWNKMLKTTTRITGIISKIKLQKAKITYAI